MLRSDVRRPLCALAISLPILAAFGSLSTVGAAPKLVEATRALAQMPQAFEPAFEPGVFLTRLGVRISSAEISMGPHSMRLTGADPRARGVGEEPLPGKTNYFLGNDPRQWRINVPNYARIRYRNVYPGIDVVYYGSGRDVEFDFELAPGADARRIRLDLSSSQLKLREPKIYQQGRVVEGRAVRKGNRVTFELAAYQRSLPLVIDPIIGFSALVGGASFDQGSAIAVDAAGGTYVTGSTTSPFSDGGISAFVTKLSADGSTLLYTTYLGGGGRDLAAGYAIAVDAAGSAFVTGQTYLQTFPVVNPAQRSSGGGSEAFVAKLSPDGATLLYSTYLGGGGHDYASGIAIDTAGSAYITGTTTSDDFPSRNAFQSKRGGVLDAFVTRLTASGAFAYSTYFGGKTDDSGLAIAVDSAGSAYLTGYTWSIDFPVKDAIKAVNPGGGDAFIAKFTADGSSLVWSTFLGGTGFDESKSIAVDASRNVFVAGSTRSRDFPTVGGFQPAAASAVLRKSVDGAVTFAVSDAGLPNGVSALAIDPINASNIYAGVSQNVYKTTDAGLTWSKVLEEPGVTFISQIAIDPSSPSTVYAGSSGVVFKTTDGGATWKSLKYGGATVMALAVDPKNSSIVYAGSGAGNSIDGLYYSSDGGETWTRPGFAGFGRAVKALAIAPSNPRTLYANSGNNLYRSTDGAGSWSLLTTPFFIGGIVGVIQIDPSNASLLYVVGSPKEGTGFNSTLIFKSADGGESWSDSGFRPVTAGGTSNSINLYALAMHAGSGTIYVASSRGIFKTTDGFGHSTLVNSTGSAINLAISASAGTLYAASPESRDGFVARLNADGKSYQYVTYLGGAGDDGVNSIAVDAAGNAFVAGSTLSSDFPAKDSLIVNRAAQGDGFVAKLATDGATLVYSSYAGAAVSGLALDPRGAAYLTGNWTRTDFFSDSPRLTYLRDTVFRTDDAAANWSGAVFPTGFIASVTADPRAASRLFAIGGNGAYRSVDAGRSWSLVQMGGFPGGLAIDPVNAGTLWYGQPNGVYKSTDGGDNWHMTKGLTNGGGASIAVDPRNPSVLYVAPYAGLFSLGVPTVFKSVDGGENWTPLTFRAVIPLGGPPRGNALAIDSQSNVYILIGEKALFKSADGGVTFNQVVSAPAAYLIAVDSATPAGVYLGGATGLFRSTDGAVSFSKAYDGPIRALAVDPAAPATLYLSALAPGVLKSTDRGATWRPTGLAIPFVTSVTVDTLTPGRVYASTALDPADVFVIKVVE